MWLEGLSSCSRIVDVNERCLHVLGVWLCLEDLSSCSRSVWLCLEDLSSCSRSVWLCLEDLSSCSRIVWLWMEDLSSCSRSMWLCLEDLSSCSRNMWLCLEDLSSCSRSVWLCLEDLSSCSRIVWVSWVEDVIVYAVVFVKRLCSTSRIMQASEWKIHMFTVYDNIYVWLIATTYSISCYIKEQVTGVLILNQLIK